MEVGIKRFVSDTIQNKGVIVWMKSNDFWAMWCTKNVHEIDKIGTTPFTNSFLVVYFDDILTHNKHEEKHVHHLKLVSHALRDNKLYLNLKKYEFVTSKLLFLGFIISSYGVSTDKQKVVALKGWPIPSSVQEVMSFHVLATFYRRFIRKFTNFLK